MWLARFPFTVKSFRISLKHDSKKLQTLFWKPRSHLPKSTQTNSYCSITPKNSQSRKANYSWQIRCPNSPGFIGKTLFAYNMVTRSHKANIIHAIATLKTYCMSTEVPPAHFHFTAQVLTPRFLDRAYMMMNIDKTLDNAQLRLSRLGVIRLMQRKAGHLRINFNFSADPFSDVQVNLLKQHIELRVRNIYEIAQRSLIPPVRDNSRRQSFHLNLLLHQYAHNFFEFPKETHGTEAQASDQV